jgi:hypothetical protein
MKRIKFCDNVRYNESQLYIKSNIAAVYLTGQALVRREAVAGR